MTPPLVWAVDVVLLIALVASVITDLKWRRIPDWITAPTLLIGIAIGLAASGWGESGFTAQTTRLLVAMGLVLFADMIASYLPDRVVAFADWVIAPFALIVFGWAVAKDFSAGEGFSPDFLDPSGTSALAGALALWSFFRILAYTGGLALGDVKLMAAVGALIEFRSAAGVLVFVALAGGVQGIVAKLAQTKPGRSLAARLGVQGTDSEDFARTVPYGIAIAVGSLAFRLFQRLAL